MASDADDGGGSFWATFHGPAAGAPELTALEQLLQDPACSIEAVLDDEEVIQEFKSGNEKLLARMKSIDACLQLVEYITRDPPENASHARNFRYPFVSVELMTCNSDFFEAFVDPANVQVLDTLWAFLEATPPEDLNPVLVGYFSRAVSSLLNRHMVEVVEYLRKRGAEGLLQSFFDRMHSRSLAELFVRLLRQEYESQMTFPVQNIVKQLLARLEVEDDGHAGDTQENVKLVMQDLITQKDCLCWGEDLIAQLTAPETISCLLNHIFSGKADIVSAAAGILSTIIWHCYASREGRGDTLPCSPSTLSPMSPPLLTLGDPADDIVNTGALDPLDDLDVEAAPQPRASASSSPPRSPAIHPSSPSTGVHTPGSTVMREVCQHFKRIRALLDAVLANPLQVPLPHGIVPGIGGTTLEVMTLLTMLVRTGCEEILEVMHKQDILPRCLEIFFRHPWSSLLHFQIRSMLDEVLSSGGGVRQALVLKLLTEGGLAQRIVNEYREESQYSSGERKKHPRVGYMGHLHHMCQQLQSFGSNVAECGQALEAVDGWTDVVLPAIAATEKLHTDQLGGGIPDGSAGLASSGSMNTATGTEVSTSIESGEDDFVLDDLADLDSVPGDGQRRQGNDFVDFAFDPDWPSTDSRELSNSMASADSFSHATPGDWSASFEADFSQAQSFNADFTQANTKADLEPFVDASQPAGGSFWDSEDAFASTAPAVNSQIPVGMPASPSQEWAAFDSAGTPPSTPQPPPQPLAPESMSADALRQEDLLNVLGGSLLPEKRDNGSQAAGAQFPAARQNIPLAAVPSTCAPTTSLEVSSPSSNDSSWVALGNRNTSFPPSPVQSPSAGHWPGEIKVEPVMEPARVNATQPAVGAENLFALLGEGGQAPAPFSSSSATPPASSPMSQDPFATPWPATNGGWQADFGGQPLTPSPTASPTGAAVVDPFGAPSPASSPHGSTPSTPGSDRSWVADFDPLA